MEDALPYKLVGDRRIYASRNFGDFKKAPGRPKIADFGLAVRVDVPALHTHPIQADLFQAPEMIMEAGWSYSADIWNLGAMVSDKCILHLEHRSAILTPLAPKDIGSPRKSDTVRCN